MKKYVVVTIVLSVCLVLLIGTNIYQKMLLEDNKKIIADALEENDSYSSNLAEEKNNIIEAEKLLRETVLKNKTQIEEYNLWEEKNKELEVLLK